MLSLPPQPDNVWGTLSSLSNVYLGVSPGVDGRIVRYYVHIIPTVNLHLHTIVVFKSMAFFRPQMTRRTERHWACLARCEGLLAIGRDYWNVTGRNDGLLYYVVLRTQTENVNHF
jgi:hypothetical protein